MGRLKKNTTNGKNKFGNVVENSYLCSRKSKQKTIMTKNTEKFKNRYIKLYNEVHDDIVSMFNEITAGSEQSVIDDLGKYHSYLCVSGSGEAELLTKIFYNTSSRCFCIVCGNTTISLWSLPLNTLLTVHYTISEAHKAKFNGWGTQMSTI